MIIAPFPLCKQLYYVVIPNSKMAGPVDREVKEANIEYITSFEAKWTKRATDIVKASHQR